MNRETNQLQESALIDEVRLLFQDANSCRFTAGITNAMQDGYICEATNGGETELIRLEKDPGCDCSCGDNQSCELCEKPLIEPCSMDECLERFRKRSPFDGIANLLTLVKQYEYQSLAENAYAEIGNKPFKLSANKDTQISPEQQEEIARYLHQYIDGYLKENEVRINELPYAFNLDTISQLTDSLAEEVRLSAQARLNDSVAKNEAVIERIFKRTDFMKEYLQIHKDITQFPIGVMWIDDKKIVKTRYVSNGVMKIKHDIDSDASRISPYYFWATSDWTLHRAGRAVFKLSSFSAGDIRRWKGLGVSGSEKIDKNIDCFLEDHPSGYRAIEAMLFNDHYLLKRGTYDVFVCRGTFPKDSVEKLGVEIPKLYEQDDYIPIECYHASDKILRLKVMEVIDDNLGVYTTLFRRSGDSIWGYSLREFIYPFAKLYEGSIKALDKDVGKSVMSIIQMDTGVVEDFEKYMRRDPNTGEVTMDYTDDMIVEFDSGQAFSHQFSGKAIHTDQFPSNIGEILPVLDVVFAQLERLTGIPNMLINGANISSALRTDSTYNAAFVASSKTVRSLLRESEQRILRPAIEHIFVSLAMKGEMKDFLMEAEPEILLSDTLVRETNDDLAFLNGVNTLMQFGNMIPEERLHQLINTVGRRIVGLDVDLIKDAGVLSTSTNVEQKQGV